MARAQIKFVVTDQLSGKVIQNAKVFVYETGTTTPVADLFAAPTGGAAIGGAFLISDSQGTVEGYVTTPRNVRLRVTDNSFTAYYPNTPGHTLSFSFFDEDPTPAYEDPVEEEQSDVVVFNVKGYYAAGDGVTPDAGPVQTTLDTAAARASGVVTGGTVFAPAGDYALEATVVVDQQALIIKGAGRGVGGTTFKWAGPAGQPMFDVRDSSSVVFEDMNIIGDDAAPPSAGIFLNNDGSATVGTNEHTVVRRVSFGRRYRLEAAPDGDMERGVHIGGTDGNNDQYAVDDCQFYDATVAGVAIDNTQSVWGTLRNLAFEACAIGLSNRAAHLHAWNLTFNRSGTVDIDHDDGRLHVFGFYSEHAPKLWTVGSQSSFYVWGGNAQLQAEMTGAYWATVGLAGPEAGGGAGLNTLWLEGLRVYDAAAAGDPKLQITGSSSVTNPAYVYIRGCSLPNGAADSGYEINGFVAGTPVHVDIQQGTYWRRQVVQSTNPASYFTPVLSRSIVGSWYQENVAASQTAVMLSLAGQPTHTQMIMPRGGYVSGIAVRSNLARTAGTLTAEVYKNGVAIGLTATLDATNTATATTLQDAVDAFNAGDQLAVRVTTDGSWAPTTADIIVSIEVTT